MIRIIMNDGTDRVFNTAVPVVRRIPESYGVRFMGECVVIGDEYGKIVYLPIAGIYEIVETPNSYDAGS